MTDFREGSLFGSSPENAHPELGYDIESQEKRKIRKMSNVSGDEP